ncbi:hypothetical protein [Caulobacter sp. UNC279MFTsu5.1]|uniref:hypothetical protein n=1 Tax=Caulobacter sp. UNC279MFTsu5.1 TaxID=1502775 RepID=UPI000363419C|nr:hypothetical protein [Caulobacter sp. UNC279MFTsu5.1]SFK41962.1 hypothetical protein SAMN02799626_04247 [Caulobacter sp. UNC279MFTsu5.1]
MTDDIDETGLEDDDGGGPPAEPASYEPIALAGMEDAPEGTESLLKGFPNPDVSESPVIPLGFAGAKVWFAMPEGELRSEVASKVGAMLRTDIFACQAGASFLTYWRDRADKFQREPCAIWFVRKCREAGFWDSSRPIRSLGVWPGEAGAVMLHRGDEVWSFASGRKVDKRSIAEMMRVRSGPLYRLAASGPKPGKPCTVEDGAWIRRQFDNWHFEPIGIDGLTGADVMAGWLVGALLGAVAPFRGHLMLNALQGSGKTTLVHLVHALMSALAGPVIDSFSEAGFRSDLSGMARPVLIDEAEGGANAHGGAGVVEQALGVLRRMSTGDGGVRKQVGQDGNVATQTAVGSVMLAAILPPKLGPADGSRIVEVRLLPLAAKEGQDLASDDDLATIQAKAEALAPKLLARILLGARRYRSDVAMVKAALQRAKESPRTADLIAMLAAGRRLLLHDEPLTPEMADTQARFWRPLLAQRESIEVVTNPGADAFAHLMAASTDQFRNDRRLTIGIMVDRLAAGDREYIGPLKAHGMLFYEDVGPDGRTGPWLIVSNHHPVLEKIFSPTKWQDWRRALSYLDALGPDYQTWPTKQLRYGAGVQQRGLAIPLTPLLDRLASQASRPVTPSVPEQDIEWQE